ncbi:hypothetical protein G6F40_015412 [Rhizopus arrhizus]|nr:hypothetical protein G6F40_015412 [Rhizopus arrhizus]
MARQLGEEVGGTVGYRIRFENKVSARTRIEVVTEGILTRMLQDDPMLEDVGAILPGTGAGRAGAAARRPAPGGDVGHAGWRATGALPRCTALEQRGPQLPGGDQPFPGASRRSTGTAGAPCGAAGAGRTSR